MESIKVSTRIFVSHEVDRKRKSSLSSFIYTSLLLVISSATTWTFLLLVHPVSCQVSFPMRKLAYSTNQFGLDLMRAMDRSESNMAFCPFCISSSLSMMLSGAHGSTATSLRHALYLWGMNSNEINVAFYDMMNHLGVNVPSFSRSLVSSPVTASRSFGLFDHHPPMSPSFPPHHLHHLHPGNGFIRRFGLGPKQENKSSQVSLNPSSSSIDVSFLTNVYVQRDFPINYHYHMALQRFYRTVIHPLDFHFSGEETRQHINAIVEKQTNGKIHDILPDRVSPATQLLLLSALYFKGNLDVNMVAITPRNPVSHANFLPPTSLPHHSYPHHYMHPLHLHQHSLASGGSPVRPVSVLSSSGSPTAINALSSSSLFAPSTVPPVSSSTPPPLFSLESLTSVFGVEPVILEARNARLRYKFDSHLNSTTIEMPFKGGLITLVLMMPSDANGLEMLLTRLSAQVLTDVVNSLEVKRINLRVSTGNLLCSNYFHVPVSALCLLYLF